MDVFDQAPYEGPEQGEWHIMVNAVIFVLSRHLMTDADRCIRHCLMQRYNIVGVIKDDWMAAIRMTREGTATVIIAAGPDRVDPDREPRIEYVTHDGPHGQHRPRLVE